MKDRVAPYLKHVLDDLVFLEFTPEYISKRARINFMAGVPVPVKKELLARFAGGEGLDYEQITEAMVTVMGADPGFRHNARYAEFMRQFNPRILKQVVKKGVDHAEDEEYLEAALHLRAALYLDENSLDAVYNYARVCRQLYLNQEGSGDPDYVMTFKTEAFEFFQATTLKHPRFAQAYYFLGYAFLNAGKYRKAEEAWQAFLKRSRNLQDRKEIRTRLDQLHEPMVIEEGCDLVMAGKWKEGLALLEPYKTSSFEKWWPLSYYLGVAYSRLGNKQEAIVMLKRVLSLTASHVESMQELAALYQSLGDKENEEKYANKAKLILDQRREEAMESPQAKGSQKKKKIRLVK